MKVEELKNIYKQVDLKEEEYEEILNYLKEENEGKHRKRNYGILVASVAVLVMVGALYNMAASLTPESRMRSGAGSEVQVATKEAIEVTEEGTEDVKEQKPTETASEMPKQESAEACWERITGEKPKDYYKMVMEKVGTPIEIGEIVPFAELGGFSEKDIIVSEGGDYDEAKEQSAILAVMDLDGDGTKEKIRVDVANQRSVISVNQTQCVTWDIFVSNLYAISLDGKRVFLVGEGDNDSCIYSKFCRYQENSLEDGEYILKDYGEIETAITSCTVNDDKIYGVGRELILATVELDMCWTPATGEDGMMKYTETGYFSCGKYYQKFGAFTLNKEITAYEDLELRKKIKLKPQGVRFIKADASMNYILVECKDGTKGWVEVEHQRNEYGYITHTLAETGEDAYKYFDGLSNAG